MHIDTKSPIEVGDFVSVFTSVASQYQKFIRENYPDISDDADIYVTKIREGSIEADLIPWATAIGAVVATMDGMLVIEDFVRRYTERLASYFTPGGRDSAATQNDLKDFMGQVAAIANDPDGSARIEAAYYEDGKREIRAGIKFTSRAAKAASVEMERHKRELERKDAAEHQRVLMVFRQSNIKNIALGKRTGEWVLIEEISERDLPLVYASDLAEERIKYEITNADENVYKRGFIVDVNVATKGGRPVAYRLTNVHQVIDLPDQD